MLPGYHGCVRNCELTCTTQGEDSQLTEPSEEVPLVVDDGEQSSDEKEVQPDVDGSEVPVSWMLQTILVTLKTDISADRRAGNQGGGGPINLFRR